MKVLAIILSICISSAFAILEDKCTPENPQVPEVFKDVGKQCLSEMQRQIQKEIDASTIYMSMGAYFSQDTINRPGFSKFFFHAAHEERDHAQALISYLLIRGEMDGVSEKNQKAFGDLISVPQVEYRAWTAVDALKEALKLEAEVTRSIKEVIRTCDEETLDPKFVKEYNLVDFLSGDFLTEQYEGQRDLAGKISTLSKMIKTNGELGEFLFDKDLLA